MKTEVSPSDSGSPRSKDEGPLRFSRSDVLLCLGNARRLMKDSRKVSQESRLLLLELALEELAKGYMIFYRILAVDADKFKAAKFPGSDQLGAAKELLDSSRNLFSDSSVRRAFKWHEVKVEFIELLGKTITLSPPIPIDDRSVVSTGLPFRTRILLARGRVGGYRRISDASLRQTVGRVLEIASTPLDRLAKRATYVDLNEDETRCVGPVADRAHCEAIDHFNRIFGKALEAVTVIFLRAS
jgi:hypothetical protein